MKFFEAFNETVFRFRLKAKDLSERSGLTEAQISLFKSGRNIRIDNLERLLEAMPESAREYMLLLVAKGAIEAVPIPKIGNDHSEKED
ncbi:MAG: helix-turn-helix domain-containing protein [Elainellaceae cyanobacterium]